jgi:hypothetical protein
MSGLSEGATHCPAWERLQLGIRPWQRRALPRPETEQWPPWSRRGIPHLRSRALRYATLRCPISALGPISTAITSLNSVSFTYATGARPLVGRSSAQPLLIGVQRFG